MNIALNKDIRDFFHRCQTNLANDRKNAFLNMRVTADNENNVKRKMKKAGFQEFSGPENTWPSLFIDTQEYLKNPYTATIRLDVIEDDIFQYSKQTIFANELFNLDAIRPDINRELNDSMVLRALSEPYEAAFLWQGDEVWMMDSPSEARTNDPFAKKACGNVLTFGLGIGYFIFMCMLNPNVTSVTVVERSPAVIRLFKKYLLPQFPQNIPVTIVEGDAFDYFNESYLERFDYVYVDIWQSSQDGLEIIERLLMAYCPPFEKVDFWIESSCFEIMPALIFLHFRDLANQQKSSHNDPFYDRLLKKITRYFDGIATTVEKVETLKHWMYDIKTIREILSIRL